MTWNKSYLNESTKKRIFPTLHKIWFSHAAFPVLRKQQRKEPFPTRFLLYLCCRMGCYSHFRPRKVSLFGCFLENGWSAHWMIALRWMWADTPWNLLKLRAPTSPTLLLEGCSPSHRYADCNYSYGRSLSCEGDRHSHWRYEGHPQVA